MFAQHQYVIKKLNMDYTKAQKLTDNLLSKN